MSSVTSGTIFVGGDFWADFVLFLFIGCACDAFAMCLHCKW